MTSLQPRSAYSEKELQSFYPPGLQLQLVQVLLRHGERSPVSARFQNAGLSPYWPYCGAAKRLTSTIMANDDGSKWDELKWQRKLETFGTADEPVQIRGPDGATDTVCGLGELTDEGRITTRALGQRLRHLYVEQLGFMPKVIDHADMIYLRSTPIPRALESLQQSFWGLYPPSTRTTQFPAPVIVTRSMADETLFPNDDGCRRLGQLSRAFAQRTADRWNNTEDMKYLSKLISKWMPEEAEVAVDSHPRLSGIMDTINSTLAHGDKTRLPKEFYNEKGRNIIDKISTEEWFSGYKESEEYRTLGIGSLLGDVVSRMIESVQMRASGIPEDLGVRTDDDKTSKGKPNIRFALSGCHDTTLAAIMSSMGTMEGVNGVWPPYTSHIAIEMFRENKAVPSSASSDQKVAESSNKSLWGSIFGTESNNSKSKSLDIRKSGNEYSQNEKARISGYYVRLRYNDRILTVPGCKPAGKHLEGDESFCTLEAFKGIVDKFTPRHWKASCLSNLGEPAFPAVPEPAGR